MSSITVDVDGRRILERAVDFIWRNARLLERCLYAYHFDRSPGDRVVAALRPYQNADGGFGNALEPDKRCPDSQPVDCEVGLGILSEVGGDQAMALRVCEFLTTITSAAGGVPFVLPSVRAFPHAPWWDTSDSPPASINPTASLAGLLYKVGVAHPWLECATEFCWHFIETTAVTEMHDLQAVLGFLQHVPDRRRATVAFEHVSQAMFDNQLITVDLADTGYRKRPLDVAPEPQALCRSLFDDTTIASHLRALASGQQDDGGWLISWPPVSPACEIEWRGIVTLGALKTLRAYGVLPSASD